MNKGSRTVEHTFNEALGAGLRTAKARWAAEPQIVKVEQTGTLCGGAGKRPDILIQDSESPPIVVETSFSPPDSDKDAIGRLGEKTTQTGHAITMAAAVAIPESYRAFDLAQITEKLVGGAPLNYALHSQPKTNPESCRRWPARGFVSGTVYDFARFLSAALPREDIEQVGSSVANQVDQAAERLEQQLPKKQQQRIARLALQRTAFKGLRTTMVLWLNALLTQQRLHQQGVRNIPSVDFTSNEPPTPSVQANIWRDILKLNWRMIFAPAVTVLEQAGNYNPGATASALSLLIRAAEQIEVARLGTQINVGAELFPKLSDDRKQAAAFYTQPAAAELLAALTIRYEDKDDWGSTDFFTQYRLADMACGTGTLLRAGYRRICSFHQRDGGTSKTLEKLHQDAMESGLIGTDISPIAAHLTASSLAAIGAGNPYGETEIGWLNVGSARGNTGALEYLQNSSQSDLLVEVAGRSHGSEDERKSVKIVDWSVDWVLMNPPYSRTRGGQSAFDIAGLSNDERGACQRRWGELTRSLPVSKKAGMAASFLALAERKVRREGRIGFVLPLTAGFADSWAATRHMIEMRYKDITAVAVAAGQALGDAALSADTHMEEMLLVATRREKGDLLGKPAPIRCVTLRHPPMRVGEAGEIARAISRSIKKLGKHGLSHPIRAGGDEIGQVAIFHAGGKGRPWGPLGVVHADLALAAGKLTEGILGHLCEEASLGVRMTTIGELFDVGPTHHLIGHQHGREPIGAFELHPVTDETDALGKDRFLWAAQSRAQRQLVVSPTHKGITVRGSHQQDEMRRKRSTLFYARNMRWTSQALLSAITEQACMGGRAWTTLRHNDANLLKAFALWANSTFGMIVHWTQGQRTQTGRSTTQIAALKRIPCPDLSRLSSAARLRAAEQLDRLAPQTLRPACQAHADSVRMQIDDAVCEMFRLMPHAGGFVAQSRDEYNDQVVGSHYAQLQNVAAILRRLWCAEPSVHGSNRTALALLNQVGGSE